MILVDLGRISFPIGIFWAGFCRRKTVPGGRKDCGRRGRPELPKKEVPGAMVALVDPVDRVRRGRLSTSPPGTRSSAQKKGGRSLLFMRGCFDIAALSRVLRKVALSRPASVATGDSRAPVRRSKLSIRRCHVLPVPTLSPRSFSLFYSFGIIGSRVGERISSLPCGSDLPLCFARVAVLRGRSLFSLSKLLDLPKET